MAVMDWAEIYKALGLQVIPLWGILNGVCRCREGADCKQPGKHPRRAWQGEPSHAPGPLDNWAVATDPLIVLDFDSVAAFDAMAPQLDDTFTVRTLKGVHVWYLADPDRPKRCQVGWKPQVDIRARGGIVVAPPSRTVIQGQSYEAITDLAPVRAPEWLMEQLPEFVPHESRFKYTGVVNTSDVTHPHFRPLVDRILGNLLATQEGGRNLALFKATARLAELHAGGYVGSSVREELVEAALRIGLAGYEIERTIGSGWRLDGK